ncbi:MAG: DUF4363 family protein [Oscillospiraceae bacterium]|jgi:hypothetical protein|nr:DUF4363 family protein [Oscillospiraceae bacterium]
MMIKEFLAAALLAALFIGAVANIRALDSLRVSIVLMIDEAEHAAGADDPDAAARAAEDAARLWENSDAYTHIVLRHSVIEDVSDKLGELAKAAYAGNSGEVIGAAKNARSRMESVVEIERVKMGSIF